MLTKIEKRQFYFKVSETQTDTFFGIYFHLYVLHSYFQLRYIIRDNTLAVSFFGKQ